MTLDEGLAAAAEDMTVEEGGMQTFAADPRRARARALLMGAFACAGVWLISDPPSAVLRLREEAPILEIGTTTALVLATLGALWMGMVSLLGWARWVPAVAFEEHEVRVLDLFWLHRIKRSNIDAMVVYSNGRGRGAGLAVRRKRGLRVAASDVRASDLEALGEAVVTWFGDR